MSSLWNILHALAPFAGILALLAAFLLLLFTVAILEKRLTFPYLPAEEQAFGQLHPYVRAMSDDLNAAGFSYGGVLRHAKPSVKVLATAWLSPDRATLVITGAGTTSGLRNRQTWFFSPLDDGTFLVTTDRNDEGDSSGLFKIRRVLNARFSRLWNFHYKRLMEVGPKLRSFAQATPIECATYLYAHRAHVMVVNGYARFVDPEKTIWRHTPRGGLAVCGQFFKQLATTLPSFWRVYLPGPRVAESAVSGFPVIPVAPLDSTTSPSNRSGPHSSNQT